MPSSDNDNKSSSSFPRNWSSLSAQEKAEYYYKSKEKEEAAAKMSSSSDHGRESDSRESCPYMRPYAYFKPNETDEHERQSNRVSDTRESNPFIAFRRYADSQISSVLQGIIGLPSAFGSLLPKTEWEEVEEARRRAREMRTWGGVGEIENRREKFPPRADELEQLLQPTFPFRSPGDPGSKQNDRSSKDIYGHDSNDPAEMALHVKASTNASPLNDFGYFLFSPYSPLHLSNDVRFQDGIQKWKDAYDDLRLIERGEEMRDPATRDNEKPCHSGRMKHAIPGLGIAIGGTNRNIPSLHQALFGLKDPSLVSESQEDDEDAQTELDLYEHFLRAGSLSTAGESEDQAQDQLLQTSSSKITTHTSSDSPPESIISTLTTTERQTLPDGTVHTKIVLKKRFADGREESTETVHKTRNDQASFQQDDARTIKSHGPVTEAVKHTKREKEASKEPNGQKGGWFWSK